MIKSRSERAITYLSLLGELSAAFPELRTPAQAARIALSRAMLALDGLSMAVLACLNTNRSLEIVGVEATGSAKDRAREKLSLPTQMMNLLMGEIPQWSDAGDPLGGAGSWSAIPIAVNGEPMAILNLSFAERRQFDDLDRAFMMFLGYHIGEALTVIQLRALAVQAELRAQDAVREQETFLTQAAHELRTPITTLRGFVETLLRRADRGSATLNPAEMRETLYHLDQESVKLAALVERMISVDGAERDDPAQGKVDHNGDNGAKPVAAYILVVDDEPGIQAFIKMALADEGYEVRGVSDGRRAFELIAREPPALILLDMLMPEMDGQQFMEAYRTRPGPHAPVIVLTANRDATKNTASMGVVTTLAKPFALDDLIAVVQKHMP